MKKYYFSYFMVALFFTVFVGACGKNTSQEQGNALDGTIPDPTTEELPNAIPATPDAGPGSSFSTVAQKKIGLNGGTVESVDRTLALTIPYNALSSETTITINQTKNPPPGSLGRLTKLALPAPF